MSDNPRLIYPAFGRSTPGAVATVRAADVRDLGLWSHRSVRLDLAVLSALYHHARVAALPDRTWSRRVLDYAQVRSDPHLPEILDLGPGEFWVSRERVARDLAARWRFADVAEGPHDGALGEPEFESGWGPKVRKPKRYPGVARFEKNVRNAFLRLADRGYVREVRTVQFARQRPRSLGSVFEVTAPDFVPGAAFDLPAPDAMVLHPNGPDAALEGLLDGADDGAQVAVVDVVGAGYLLADRYQREPGGSYSARAFRDGASPLLAAGPFRTIESRRSLLRGGRLASFPGWPKRQARRGPGDDVGPEAERHHSVGAWRARGGALRKRTDDEAYVVPWVVLDFDRGRDADDAFEAAQRAVRELVALGLHPDDVLCCPTGGRGVHVHVPCGALGTPLYRDAEAAKGALRRFVASVVDEDVDEAVLSPFHLVRAVGSGYYSAPEASAPLAAAMIAPVKFKVRVPTREFLSTSSYEGLAVAATFSPTRLPDPRYTDPVPLLVASGSEASYRFSHRDRAARRGKPFGVRAVEGGVGEGGRNSAAFVMATYYLDQREMSEGDAWAELVGWNETNVPPMDLRELDSVLRSAVRRTRT